MRGFVFITAARLVDEGEDNSNDTNHHTQDQIDVVVETHQKATLSACFLEVSEFEIDWQDETKNGAEKRANQPEYDRNVSRDQSEEIYHYEQG